MRQTNLQIHLLRAASCLLTTALLLAAIPADATVYCWTDDSGQKQCGDHVPPQYSKKDREVINQSGQTVKVLPREKTDAERAAEQQAAEQAARLQKANEEQARNDQYLISTFESVDDLKRMRDERLASIDGNTHINEMSLDNTQKSLVDLKGRREQFKTAGKPVPPYLNKQIQDYEARLVADQKGLESRKQERQALAAKFDRDIARYRALKGDTGGTGAAAP